MNIEIKPRKLKGEIHIPPSKSLSHRAIIAAALSEGVSVIENVILSQDIKATIEAMRSLGVEITVISNGRYKLIIKGKEKLELLNNEINCHESGSTLRFLVPFFALVEGEVTFTGRNKLIERPLDSYYKIFDEKGVEYSNNLGNLPLKIKGGLKPGNYTLDGNISSQFITGLMFVLPLLDGDSKIIIRKNLESKGYVDLTIDILNKFGIEIENNNYESFSIKGNQHYKARDYKVEGDYSQAAFWIVANILDNDIVLRDLDKDSLQGDKAILDIINKMGISYEFIEDKLIINSNNDLKNISIDVKDCPDLVPILAVLASFAKGECRIYNAERLRIKESDRLKAISTELNKLGANVIEKEDGLVIKPIENIKGGKVDSWNDHRIAMALSVFSTRGKDTIELSRSEAINKSYPDFYDDFKKLGGEING